jgi:alpha-L-arabinofuranosidase
MGSALLAASTLKAFIESPQTQIANFHVLNDVSIMGWLGTLNGQWPSNPVWAATARCYAFELFTKYFGARLIRSTVASPTFNTQAVGAVQAVANVPWLDVVSSLSADGKTMYVIGINKHFDENIAAAFALKSFSPAKTGVAWTVNGTGIDANTGTVPLQIPGVVWALQHQDPENPQFYNGAPQQITMTSAPVSGISSNFTYTFPAHSVTALILSRP